MDPDASTDGDVELSSTEATLTADELAAAIDELLEASENVSTSSRQISELASDRSGNTREVAARFRTARRPSRRSHRAPVR